MMMMEEECECSITSLNSCVRVAGPGHHGVAVPVVISLGWWWSPLLLSVTSQSAPRHRHTLALLSQLSQHNTSVITGE